MIDLIAQGGKPGQRWCRPLPVGQPVVIGRESADWSVTWDPWMSRRHAELVWDGTHLHVRRLPTALNPLCYQGEEREAFTLGPDEQFVIASTGFLLGQQQPTLPQEGPAAVQVRTVRVEDLERLPFRDANRRLDVLSRLPGVISSATGDTALFTQLANLLLAGIPRADAVALVSAPSDQPAEVQVLYQDGRRSTEGAFRPSNRLVVEAVVHQRQTVLHIWPAGVSPERRAYTLQGDFDWAFCTPVRNDTCPGWGLYVTGRFSAEAATTALGPWEANDLSDDLKFAELAAATLGSLRQVRALQERQVVLGQFFSPEILRVLTAERPEAALLPRETDVTVLFCDLRGFSREVERGAADLSGVLQRVSAALEVMTQHILDRKGAIADFLGDAAMGFWGWPLEQPDRGERACRAALGIQAMFECFAMSPGHPLAGFQVGVGIASGRAVAGKIGAHAQAKVTVFGPVVNLAARLEGMTRLLRVPILLDEATARSLQSRTPSPRCRVRRLARVLPFGLDTPLIVCELLPSAEESGVLSDEHLGCYEQALEAFLSGQWGEAYELLHRIPPRDHGKDLLTGFILQHNHTPPPGWDGVIRLEGK